MNRMNPSLCSQAARSLFGPSAIVRMLLPVRMKVAPSHTVNTWLKTFSYCGVFQFLRCSDTLWHLCEGETADRPDVRVCLYFRGRALCVCVCALLYKQSYVTLYFLSDTRRVCLCFVRSGSLCQSQVFVLSSCSTLLSAVRQLPVCQQ